MLFLCEVIINVSGLPLMFQYRAAFNVSVHLIYISLKFPVATTLPAIVLLTLQSTKQFCKIIKNARQ